MTLPALSASTAGGSTQRNTCAPTRETALIAFTQGEKGDACLALPTLCGSRDNAKWQVVVPQSDSVSHSTETRTFEKL